MNVRETLDIDVIIAVMGATGTGKSTFINLISGSELHVGTDLNSCTSYVEATAPFTFQDRRVVLLDTPGFDDTTKSDTDILKLVAEYLADTYQKGVILSGVIYMHRISDVRMGGIAMRNFGMFRKLCGDKSLKNVAIVTTFWSEVDPAVGDAHETELRSDDMFFKPALNKQAKLLRHDGTLDGARKIVVELMNNRPMALRIQEEMVDENKSLVDTAAGTELNRELEQARKHAMELKELRDEMVVAKKESDEESRKKLQMAERMDFWKLAANPDEERARIAERFADMTTAAKESTAQIKELQEQIRAQAQERSNAERDAAQKELAELKQRHEAERKQETQMKELQEMLPAQERWFNEQLADMKRQLKIEESSTGAAERSREGLAKTKQKLQSSKSAPVQKRAEARQSSQAAAETELANVQRQLDVMQSSNAALNAREKSLMQQAADAQQKSQAAAAAAETELANVKRQLDVMKSSNTALEARKKYLGDARTTLKAAAAAAKRELAGVKRELDVMEYTHAGLVQDSADAEQKSQAAAARLREALGVMKSSKEALVQESALAEQKSQVAAAAAETKLKEQARKHEQELKKIREEMEAAIRERDEESRQDLLMAERKLKAEMERVDTDVQKLKADHHEDRARMAEELLDMSNLADKAKMGMGELNEKIRAQEQQMADAELDMAKKELAESEQRRDAERKREIEMKEFQDKVQAQQEEVCNAERDAMRKEVAELKRRHQAEWEKDTQMKKLEEQLRAQEQQKVDAERDATQDRHGKEMKQDKEDMAVVQKKRDEKTRLELEEVEKKQKAEMERLQTEFQKRVNADRDAAQKEVAELKRQHEEERERNTQMQELQEQLQSQEQKRSNELANVKRQLDVMKSSSAALEARVKSSIQEVATVMKVLFTTEAPIKRLADFLLDDRQAALHDLFKTVLLSVSDWKAGETTDTYRRILGIIVISQVPLTDVAIADLLGLGQDSCRTALRRLGYVIQWSAGQARILYQSLSDYLTDQSACSSEPWFIDVKEHQHALTLACLRVMDEGLHFNMGDLKTSYIANADVPGLSAHVETVISQTLSYSCRFWGHHLRQMSPEDLSILDSILQFFELKFLYWLEVLSLSGEMAQASRVLVSVMEHVEKPSNKVYAFAQDGLKFVGAFGPALACSTPHIYLSCVPFAPRGSLIKQQYSRALPNILMVESGMDGNWPALQQVLEGHNSTVYSVAFSPDGQRIASGLYDNTIRVWDAKTGALIAGPFTGHTENVCSVAFSPDGQRIASGSDDNTIRVWDAKTGALVAGPFRGHTTYVNSVAFSPDGQRIASGSSDKTIRVWDAKTGALVTGPFTGHTSNVISVAFSPDGQHIASGSPDKTIRVWDAKTGTLVAGPFTGHTYYVCSVMFSPDSQHIVSGSYDKTIRVWNAKTGTLVAGPFTGHTKNVYSVAFSPDGQRIASGSGDETIRVWDAQTGALVAGPFTRHTNRVYSVAFSPDGQHIASGSQDSTIRIWDATMGPLVAGPFEGCTASVNTTSSSQQQHSDAHNGLGSRSQLENGWMVNSTGGLLFYVPYVHREGLWWRPDTAVTSSGSTCLDLTRFVHGEDWVRCHI